MQHLASYRGEDSVITVAPYDEAGLRKVFEDAARNQWFIEAVFLEPVMGEGDPGRSVPPAFYAVARELSAHGSLLLLDSIQAGLRAHGVLSVVDYPGFEGQDPPDMETYSALNAAQYPLSVLAVTEHAAQLYRKGIYGNTMTSNPRALDVACATLAQLTPQVRANIAERGAEAVRKLEQLKAELGGLITKVQRPVPVLMRAGAAVRARRQLHRNIAGLGGLITKVQGTGLSAGAAVRSAPTPPRNGCASTAST